MADNQISAEALHADDASTLFQQGLQAMRASNMPAAQSLFERAIERQPDYAEAYSKLGVIKIIQRQKTEAQNLFEKAISIDRNCIPAYHNLSLVLCELEYFQEAEDIARQALAIDPSYIRIYEALGNALKVQQKLQEAEALFKKVVEKEPNNFQAYANWGAVLTELGRKAEAQKALKQAIQLNPFFISAHRMLSTVKEYQNREDEHIVQLEQLLAHREQMSPAEEADLRFALGNTYDKIQLYEQAFKNYERANALVRSTFSYSIEETKKFFDQIEEAFTHDFIESYSKDGLKDTTPLFIVGMPRSGTTLVEQILTSHPDVFGAGELNYISALQFRDMELSQEHYARDVKALTGDKIHAMAESYLEKLRGHDAVSKYITDKMPHNFQHIGLIKTLFPSAKIIHCKRDARDTCLSIFKMRFSGHLPFAYNLEEIFEYYRLYDELMEYWDQLFGDDIFHLQYEDLVQEPDEMIREMLDYCELDWNENCLHFYKTDRPVTTASTLQVRKPLYKSAVGSWKNYELYLRSSGI